ncbi:hypothetical protein BCR35DRAFT_323810 [Leucosporidium creatinivorum]|uniref:T6SS Phospholipase effector Tle1-like catalytic domain-containing protein n=1 Tax=Leucosporidium creatinivorum TaxID=106004 RepID=A0A1Y2FZW2_9BASI|nr:hypothetical protein BCR35DRAFT_323810 [Leucosporidium creatinivorum]
MRRLIVLADGTWQDADYQPDPDMLTNVSRFARALLVRDTRTSPPTEQIKLYTPGIGTGQESLLGAVQGALGTGLLGRVREIYDFICLNYDQEEGTEITLVGFSRGAYCVRLVATLINLIGVLAPSKMHRFPALFDALCHRGQDAESEEHLNRLLEENEPDRQEQLEALDGRFPVKAVLVFDTVPTRSKDDHDPPTPTLPIRFDAFGLPSEELGPHIEVALQALALDEGRKHYMPLLWRRDPSRQLGGQFLLQTWFSGCHTDVGGGYKAHDLGDLSFFWAISHLKKLAGLAFDTEYLASIAARTTAPWGQMEPHHGFSLTKGHIRQLPLHVDPATNEYIHDSVLSQPSQHLNPETLKRLHIRSLFLPLRKLERTVEEHWSYDPEQQPEVKRKPRSRRGSTSLLGGIERRWQALKDFEGTEAAKFAGAGDAFKQARAR